MVGLRPDDGAPDTFTSVAATEVPALQRAGPSTDTYPKS